MPVSTATRLNVPMYDHAAMTAPRKAALLAALERVLDSGAIGWGAEAPAFEAAFADWIGVPHAIGTNSGTAALEVALRALRIGPGDEVITAPNSDIATTAAIHMVGAKAVWVDVEPDTLNMDPAAAAAAVTPRTKALLPVDLYGHPADYGALNALAARHGLAIVADACLSLGARFDGRKIGTLATLSCFSFAPTKHLGAYGSAGAVVTADAELARRMQRLIGYGQDRGRDATGPLVLHEAGMNERLDEVQAAMLRTKLPGLAADIAGRQQRAARYGAGLAGTDVRTPVVRPGAEHSYRNYVVLVEDRDLVRETLAAAGVATHLAYAPPLHLQPVFAPLGFGAGAFPIVEHAAERLLGLPIGPHLSAEQIDYAAATLADAVRGRG